METDRSGGRAGTVDGSRPCASLDAAKVRLISAVCQDFWHPLRSIVARAELLAEGSELSHPGRAVALAEAILADTQQLVTGVGDVITLAKLECQPEPR
jgi:signal transduction histidine kinase